jgi:hypothetical protein
MDHRAELVAIVVLARLGNALRAANRSAFLSSPSLEGRDCASSEQHPSARLPQPP